MEGAAQAPERADRANLGAIRGFSSTLKLGHFGFDSGADFGSISRDQNESANRSVCIKLISRAPFCGPKLGPRNGPKIGPEIWPRSGPMGVVMKPRAGSKLARSARFREPPRTTIKPTPSPAGLPRTTSQANALWQRRSLFSALRRVLSFARSFRVIVRALPCRGILHSLLLRSVSSFCYNARQDLQQANGNFV